MRHTDWIDRDIAMYARFEWCEGKNRSKINTIVKLCMV